MLSAVTVNYSLMEVMDIQPKLLRVSKLGPENGLANFDASCSVPKTTFCKTFGRITMEEKAYFD
jgi:hypothetical protein